MSLRIKIILLILALLSTSCMGRERMRKQEETVKTENNARYYRPIHHEHSDWRISKDGARYEFKTKQDRLVLSLRRGTAVTYPPGKTDSVISSKNVDVPGSDGKSLLIRQMGKIVAEIVRDKDVIYYINRRHENSAQEHKAEYLARCLKRDRLEVYGDVQTTFIDFTPKEASSHDKLFRQVSKRKQSVAPLSLSDGNYSSNIELDTPLSPLGTAILYSEDLPLDWRTGLAIYVSHYGMNCL